MAEGKAEEADPHSAVGNATWIVGVYDLKRDPTEDEQKRIDRATSAINETLGAAAEEYDWIRWGKKGGFAKECRVGDTLIHVYNPRERQRPHYHAPPRGGAQANRAELDQDISQRRDQRLPRS
jgi:hypothetical protein